MPRLAVHRRAQRAKAPTSLESGLARCSSRRRLSSVGSCRMRRLANETSCCRGALDLAIAILIAPILANLRRDIMRRMCFRFLGLILTLRFGGDINKLLCACNKIDSPLRGAYCLVGRGLPKFCCCRTTVSGTPGSDPSDRAASSAALRATSASAC